MDNAVYHRPFRATPAPYNTSGSCWSRRGGGGGGGGSGASSLFVDQNQVCGVKKNYFGGRPPSFLGVWMSGLYLLEDPNIRPCYSLRESCPSEESREATHEQHAKGDARGLGVGQG